MIETIAGHKVKFKPLTMRSMGLLFLGEDTGEKDSQGNTIFSTSDVNVIEVAVESIDGVALEECSAEAQFSIAMGLVDFLEIHKAAWVTSLSAKVKSAGEDTTSSEENSEITNQASGSEES